MAQIVPQYGKTVVLETSDGQVTVTGIRANAILNRLNDSSRYWHFTQGDSEVYYNVDSASCGFCKVATLTYNSTLIDEVECEDGIPNCPVTAVTVNPTTASVEVGKTVKLVATTTPANYAVTWTSGTPANATVDQTGNVTGVKAGTSVITVADKATGEVKATATVTVTAAA